VSVRDLFEVFGREFPIAENVAIAAEVALVVDTLVSTEWNVELTAGIEATKTVVTGAVQIVEERRGLCRAGSAVGRKLVESSPVLVVKGLPVIKFEPIFHLQATLQPQIEMHHVWIDIV